MYHRLIFDGDGAGQKANMRGLDILKGEGLNVKVVPLPEGLDPDDVIKQRGAEAYRQCLNEAMPLVDYKLSTLKRSFDLGKTEEKRSYIAEALAIIRTVPSASEREDLLKTLRTQTGISFEALKRDLEAKSVVAEQKEDRPVKKKDSADAIKKASRFIVASFLFGADYVKGIDISDINFNDEIHAIIAKYIRSKKLMGEDMRLSELFEFFDTGTQEYEELERILDYSEGFGFDDNEVAVKYFNDCLIQLKLDDLNGRIENETLRLTSVTDSAEQARIALKISELTKQKDKIKNGDRE